jgi:uncharacterized protein (TIGR02001 family)
MKKLILATAVIAAFSGSVARAEDAKPDNEVSFNASVVSDYRYRGISQTRFKPALQGGADYTHNPTGFYAGTWLSTIKWIEDYVDTFGSVSGKGGVEWDLYAGKRGDLPGGFTYDVGGLYYYYPSNNYNAVAPNTNANTFEVYGQVGYGPAYIKYSHSLTTLFGTVDSKNSGYLDLGANIDVGAGVTLNLHAGHQRVAGTGGPGAGLSNSFYSYTDWKVGVSKTFEQAAGLTVGLAAVGTDAKDGAYASAGKVNFGKNALVLSVSKTF